MLRNENLLTVPYQESKAKLCCATKLRFGLQTSKLVQDVR